MLMKDSTAVVLHAGQLLGQYNFDKFCLAGLRSEVSNVSGYRCVSDCRSRGREFNPSPVPYFRGN